jgi:serine/threonine protein phosphatase 1
MKNYWIIGDIHGEAGLLERLLDNIRKFQPAELVFVGDYIDRGPHSREVADLLISLGSEASFLMGNHEMMMLNAMDDLGIGGSPIELWYYNGGEATLQSFGFTSFFSFQSDMDPGYLDFFRSLKMAHSISLDGGPDILVSHAGISPRIPVVDQLRMNGYRDLRRYLLENQMDPADSFLWVREAFFSADPSCWEEYLVVHGHTPVLKLKRFISANGANNFLFVENDLCMRKSARDGRVVSLDIDSGSVISGRLTGVGFFEEKDASGHPVVRMRSITVSREEIFPRDLGLVNGMA